MIARRWLIAAATLAIVAPAAIAGEGPWRVKVRGIDRDLGATPVVVELREPIPLGEYLLSRPLEKSARPATVLDDGGKRLLAFVADPLKAGEVAEFALEKTGSVKGGIQFLPDGNTLRITLGGGPFTAYRTDLGPKPILYPLIGPTGAALTRSYPMAQVEGEDRDHPHQRSFWFTHGRVNGVDFWSELPGHGAIRETSRRATGGAAMGVLHTTDEWVGPDGKVVCEDARVLRMFAAPSARILDFDVTMKATHGPVTFGDTKEGMFGLRVASALDANRKPGGTITNAEGLKNLDAWGKASPWVDYAGTLDGKAVGVAILNHPDSFRYPTTWHVRDYGLFAANPFGWKDFGRAESGEYTLPNGELVTFRYRVILHEGDTAADIASAFAGYATPPTVEVQGD